jgi:hypothetical protein
MNYKTVMMAAIIGVAGMVYGTEKEIGLNAGFEKVKSETDGTLMPENWCKNKNLASNGEAKAIWGEGKVRQGKFALQVKTQAEKSLHVYNWKSPLKVQVGEEFNITISVKGKGRFGIFFYNYAANGSFLGTTASVGGNKKQISSIESTEWLEKAFDFKVKLLKKQTPVSVRVCIVVQPGSELRFDDLTITKKESSL